MAECGASNDGKVNSPPTEYLSCAALIVRLRLRALATSDPSLICVNVNGPDRRTLRSSR